MVQPRACGPMLKFAFLSGGFSAPGAKKRGWKDEEGGAGDETASNGTGRYG